MVYRFANVEVDADRFLIRRADAIVNLEPRVLDLVIYLIHRRHRMVSKQELIEQVWNRHVVGPSVLTRAICLARKALGCPTAIRTVHTRGYQWTAPVGLFNNGDPVDAPLLQRPRIASRFDLDEGGHA